jgi:hypothetical protein
MKGTVYRQTGDVNLAAALMACGIPLSKEMPIRLIDREGAKTYASFNLAQSSADGVNKTEALMSFWTNRRGLPPEHAFVQISQFIANKPSSQMTADDWMDYAIDSIKTDGNELPGLRTYEDIPAFVKALPRDKASYILAFVYNRRLCYMLFRKARRSIYMERNGSHAMVDINLPKWQRNEILSHL